MGLSLDLAPRRNDQKDDMGAIEALLCSAASVSLLSKNKSLVGSCRVGLLPSHSLTRPEYLLDNVLALRASTTCQAHPE